MATTRKSAAKKPAARKATQAASSARSKAASKKPAKKAASAKKTAKKAASKAVKAATKKSVAKHVAKKTAASKPVPKVVNKPESKAPVAKAKPVRPAVVAPIVKRGAVGKPAIAKEGPRKPASAPGDVSSEPVHISPEDAVAHIQALLRAKQERLKRGPAWPGSQSGPTAVNGSVQHGSGNPSQGPLHHLPHARGDQSKGGKG